MTNKNKGLNQNTPQTTKKPEKLSAYIKKKSVLPKKKCNLNMKIDVDVHRAFKIACFEEGVFLHKKMEELIKKWVKKRAKQVKDESS